MTRQALARLKLKAFNAGKRAVLRDEKPTLPDCDSLSLDELEVLLNAMQDGQLAGLELKENALTDWRESE